MEFASDRINRQSLLAAANEASRRMQSTNTSQEAEVFGVRLAYAVFSEAANIIGDGDVESLQVGRATISLAPDPNESCPKDCFRWRKWCICIPWL